MYPRDRKETAEHIFILLYALANIIVFIVLGVRGIQDFVEDMRYKKAWKQYRAEVTIYNNDDGCAYLTPGSDYFYAVAYAYDGEIFTVVIRDTMEILQYSGVPYDWFADFYYGHAWNGEEYMHETYECDILDNTYECERWVLQQ